MMMTFDFSRAHALIRARTSFRARTVIRACTVTRARAVGIMCAAVLVVNCAEAQELLSLDDACSYYGEEIEDAVYGFASDQEAERAIQRIVDHTGLPPKFRIMAANVPNATADIDENGDRLILYNQSFMKRITETAQTDWAATSILAHEIGHHLSGHTLVRGGSRPEIELEADLFSGFVLFKMGATLDDAQAAMEALAGETASETHPPKSARLAAIANGWTRAKEQSGDTPPPQELPSSHEPPPPHEEDEGAGRDPAEAADMDLLDCLERELSGENVDCNDLYPASVDNLQGSAPIGNSYAAQCSFHDGSAVAIDRQNRIVTFIDGATIDVGVRRPSSDPRVQYELFFTSNDLYIASVLISLSAYNVTYYVDEAGTIWRPNAIGGVFQVGNCQ